MELEIEQNRVESLDRALPVEAEAAQLINGEVLNCALSASDYVVPHRIVCLRMILCVHVC